MIIAADTHTHLYPCYDIATALDAAFANLTRAVPETAPRGGTECVLCLTERCDCRLFRELAGSSGAAAGAWSFERRGEHALGAKRKDGAKMSILAGRQIVTAERLEILALGRDLEVPDGGAAAEILREVQGAGAVAVIPWSPGKWFSARGRIVERLLDSQRPGDLLLGDTALRPGGYGEPRIMRQARGRGFGVASGSDPLPFAGEEPRLGSYGSLFEAPWHAEDPAGSMLEILRALRGAAPVFGRRLGAAGLAFRLWKNARTKRSSPRA